MGDLVIRKNRGGGWDDGGKDRVGMGDGDGGWGGDGMGIDLMIMKRYLLMIVGCVIYIDIYVIKGLDGGVWLRFIDWSLLAL